MEEPDPTFDPNFKLWAEIEEAANLPILYGSDQNFGAQPEHGSDIDRLHFQIRAALDADYRFDPDRNMISRQYGKSGSKKISGALAITALVRSNTRQGSLLEITFQNEGGHVIQILVPTTDLSSSSPVILNILRDHGLYVPASNRDFMAFLRSWRPRTREIFRAQHGWSTDGPRFFGLRDDRVVAPLTADATLFIQDRFDENPAQLARWQDEVAAKFSGNSIGLVFLSHGFSGPLLCLVNKRSFGLNLVAGTSSGKTTVADVCANLWPDLQTESWDATPSAIEDLCHSANDCLLVLDEAPMDKPELVAKMVMQIANGRPRNARSSRGSSAAKSRALNWAVAVVSTSEDSLRSLATMGRYQGKIQGGALVRMIDICLPSRDSLVWTNVHGADSAFDLVDQITVSAEATKGVAGPCFAQRVANIWSSVASNMPALHDKAVKDLERHLGIDRKVERGPVMRVVSHFATVWIAGELASRLKILPQSSDEIRAAVFDVAKTWHGGIGKPEDPVMSTVNGLKDWIAQNGKLSLCEIDELGQPGQHHGKCVGWVDGQHYYLLRGTLAEALGVKPEAKAAFGEGVRRLVECKIVVPGGSAESLQYKLGSAFEGRPNVYRISRAALEKA